MGGTLVEEREVGVRLEMEAGQAIQDQSEVFGFYLSVMQSPEGFEQGGDVS